MQQRLVYRSPELVGSPGLQLPSKSTEGTAECCSCMRFCYRRVAAKRGPAFSIPRREPCPPSVKPSTSRHVHAPATLQLQTARDQNCDIKRRHSQTKTTDTGALPTRTRLLPIYPAPQKQISEQAHRHQQLHKKNDVYPSSRVHIQTHLV